MLEVKVILPLILIVLALFIGISIGIAISTNQQNPLFPGEPGNDDGVACTQEAMMCPDGSYVGRSGPRCEFVCPGE